MNEEQVVIVTDVGYVVIHEGRTELNDDVNQATRITPSAAATWINNLARGNRLRDFRSRTAKALPEKS